MKDSENTKFSAKSKKIIICAVAVIILITIGIYITVLVQSKIYTVAFYKIDDRQRQGITELLNKISEEKKFPIEFIQYNSEKSLKEQIPIKKPNIIFAPSGYAVESAIEKASKDSLIQADFIQGFTSSMRSAIKFEGEKISALPILSSHFEVDIDLAEFRNSNTKQINTWNDIEKFMREQKRKKESPMIFAGGNSDTFLDILGAFVESIEGPASYNEAAKILKANEKDFNPVNTAIQLCDEPSSPLATAIKQLRSWYKLGFIHQGVFSLQANDVEAFASSRLSSVLFMSLESHRTVSQNTISNYTSIYFPSEHGANSRIFTGKIYYAIPMNKSAKTEILLPELVTPNSQEALSRSTGIAPVLAQCRTPDKQADDARYWIAATTAPLAGLSNEIYLTKQQKTALAAEISSRIRN